MRRLFTISAVFLVGALCRPAGAADPVFENRTPVGFSVQDSTTRGDFILGNQIAIRVDLDQATTAEFPLIAHFHAFENSDQLSSTDTDGLQIDVAMVDVVPFGTNARSQIGGVVTSNDSLAIPIIHVAWIEQDGVAAGSVFNGGITPVYKVMYARSTDKGATFTAAVSVSDNISYFPLSPAGTSSFSTLDLEVESGGNPHVVYAFVTTADHSENENVYYAHSTDGGGTWATPLIVNDVTTVGNSEGRSAAFPRMAIDDRDNIFITYVRGASDGTGTDDVMLAKVNRYLDPFIMVPIGSVGTAGSSGGIRLTPDGAGERQTGPDVAIGDGDALHVVYFDDADNNIQHKRMNTDTTWAEVGTSGWSQDAVGATIGSFVDETSANTALEQDADFFFPTIVVDRNRLPDRVYAPKFGSAGDEGIVLNQYDDDGTTGTGITWGTASPVWATGGTPLFDDGSNRYNIELDWTITERVSAVVEDRTDDRGDLHIAFTAGHSGSSSEHDIYYARYNGTSWTLPERVADDDSDSTSTDDGIAATDVFPLSPAIAHHPDLDHIFLAFGAGTAEGFDIKGVENVNHHPYFKVLGRSITSEDTSVPVGAFQYTLTYTPINQQTLTAEVTSYPVYVHAADPNDGSGLGSRGNETDGFLTGNWESLVSSSLYFADHDKEFEGRLDEVASSNKEWGDDNDKIGLLVKLNVLGKDSSTNLQLIAGSTTDVANVSYDIKYNLTDADDTFSGNLTAALYDFKSAGLQTVQDIRIFGTLIVDQNDVTNATDGTNDFIVGLTQTYTWDDPPAALKSSALFASILRVPSGTYYIYLVADDGRNPPVFAVSPGAITLRHSPIVQQIDPTGAETVDSGVRTGEQASPYDLDFTVVDYDSDARIQLFYSSVSGITSTSVAGVYPNQKFALGKSVAGTRGTAITDSTTLSDRDRSYSWDITSPVVAAGGYFLYAVASDSLNVTVGNSAAPLTVKHSPAFTFYEPAQSTQRFVDSGSQPVFTIQWQKGPGDKDLDNNASIDFYFTTDDPAVTNHSTESGAGTLSLTNDADTRKINASSLSEDGANDIFAWDLREPPNQVPVSGQQSWLYAVISDGNTTVSLGGSLVIKHSPHILLTSRMPAINQGDIVRLEWDDYMTDDLTGTDDANIRLYASRRSGISTMQALEANVSGSGLGDTFIINSSDGTASGTITAISESSSDGFVWDTKTSTFALPVGTYSVYAAMSADATFSDNTTGSVSESASQMVVNGATGATPHMSVSPNKVMASVGDTLTFEVLVQSDGNSASIVTAVLDLGSDFEIQNTASPFTDLGGVFSAGSTLDNSSSGNQVSFSKTGSPEIIGTADDPARLASFRVVVKSGFSGVGQVNFNSTLATLGIVGRSSPWTITSGMSSLNGRVTAVPRARILATVLLEGRSPPIGNGDHSTELDIHLRLPGSLTDITDAIFKAANDDVPATADTVKVKTTSSGALTLVSVPTGRYVLTVKDTSHISGRTDTLTLRAGETLVLSSAEGFFASDIRGDASFLLDQDGRRLQAGDVTEDNEIDEDDVNAIDAAWGTDTGKPRFKQADLNNDGRVSVDDMIAAISNISNSTGFGAPPVFKPVAWPAFPHTEFSGVPGGDRASVKYLSKPPVSPGSGSVGGRSVWCLRRSPLETCRIWIRSGVRSR